MKQFLTKIPYPIAGLMLALAALGILLATTLGNEIKLICGILSALIGVSLVLKTILTPQSLVKAMGILPIASVTITFSMGLMLLATYVKPSLPVAATALWYIGFVSSVFIIVFFTFKHVFPFKLQKIYASYFVTYVGIVSAAVTAKAFNAVALGTSAFIFGLLVYAFFLPVVTYRYKVNRDIPDMLKPLIVIYGAPANLLVVGYISLGLQWSTILISVLWGLGVITTLFAWYQLFRLRQLPFYPSYSAYTFPLVIGAIATIKFNGLLAVTGQNSSIINIFGQIQTVVATVTVLYVLWHYTRMIIVSQSGQKATSTTSVS